MELVEKNNIANLCLEHKLVIKEKIMCDFLEIEKTKNKIDPLFSFKKDAKIIIFEINKL